jgi:tetraacyldisaccharide 4'-kinase
VMLSLASWLYQVVTAIRNALFDCGVLSAHSAAFPIISVGNLTAGGNAKTPLTIYIVEELKKRGFSPFVISRGYGGSERGPWLVQESDSPRRVGDEPLLIRQKCLVPVVVAKSRVAGAVFGAQHSLGNVAVLDDAFQHRWLRRDLDIVSINVGTDEAMQAFIDGECLPKGLFREARDSGLRRAGAIVLSERRPVNSTKSSPLRHRVVDLLPKGVPLFTSSLFAEGIYSLKGDGPLSFENAAAFCAIAHPENFFETLRALVPEVTKTFEFPDHHPLGEKELKEMRAAASGLPLVCTEKDAVKLQASEKDVFVLRTKTTISPAEDFTRLLINVGRPDHVK